MAFVVQAFLLCFIFTLVILPAQIKNPISQVLSYPIEIRKRVESLPEYQEAIQSIEKKGFLKKIFGAITLSVVLGIIALLSQEKGFIAVFLYSLLLFQIVNIYDLIVLDLLIFRHSKCLRIPGTEDMVEAYRNPRYHLYGALKGSLIGIGVTLLASLFTIIL